MKPPLGWTRTCHPKVTCEGEGEEGEHPKQDDGVDSWELALRGGENRYNPILVLRQFCHPSQPVEVSVEGHQIAMNIILTRRNKP